MPAPDEIPSSQAQPTISVGGVPGPLDAPDDEAPELNPDDPIEGPIAEAARLHAEGHPDFDLDMRVLPNRALRDILAHPEIVDPAELARDAGTPDAPGALRQPFWRRLRLAYVAALAVVALLAVTGVIVFRPQDGGGSAGAGAAAGGGAAQPAAGGAQPAAGGAVGDAANGGAQQPAAGGAAGDAANGGALGAGGGASAGTDASGPGGIPASCVLTSDEAGLGLGNVTWDQQSDGLVAQWALTANNASAERYVLYIHKISDANAATRAGKWKAQAYDWFKAHDPDATELIGNITGVAPGTKDQRVAGADALVSTSVEAGLPTFCSFEYADRVVAVWERPGCDDVLWQKLEPTKADPAAQEALMAPWAITVPLPDQMTGWTCPE